MPWAFRPMRPRRHRAMLTRSRRRQRMTFRDTGGRVVLFEKCAGGIYEARGLPNPYKTGNLGSDDLPFPRTEVIDPRISQD